MIVDIFICDASIRIVYNCVTDLCTSIQFLSYLHSNFYKVGILYLGLLGSWAFSVFSYCAKEHSVSEITSVSVLS
jgi:hypothetical protein